MILRPRATVAAILLSVVLVPLRCVLGGPADEPAPKKDTKARSRVKKDVDADEEPRVSELIQSLESEKVARQLAALDKLKWRGPVYAATTPALTRLLAHPKAKVRQKAAEVLADFGPAARSASAALEDALGDGNPHVRVAAADALWKIERRTDKVLPTITATLDHKRTFVRKHALRVLLGMGPAAAAAAPALKTPLTATDEEYLAKIESLGWGPETIILGQERTLAAQVLGRMGPDARQDAVPLLMPRLKDEVAQVRVAAADALWRVGQPAHEMVPTLIDGLRHDNRNGPEGYPGPMFAESPATHAAQALGRIGPDAKAAVPALIRALQHGHAALPLKAATALGQIGTSAETAIPALSVALRETEVHSAPFIHWSLCLSRNAAEALGRIGPAAAPVLIEALRDDDDGVRAGAASALGKYRLRASLAVPALTECLDDKTDYVRGAAAFALQSYGPLARSAGPALAQRMGDDAKWDHCPGSSGIMSHYTVRDQLVGALLATEPNPAEITPILADLMTKNARVSDGMVKILRSFGPAAQDAVPVLERFLDDPDQRTNAAYVLVRIAPAHPGLVESLTPTLTEQEEDYRPLMRAALALGELGVRAAPAAERLAELAEHFREYRTGRAAPFAAALAQIHPDSQSAVDALAADLAELSYFFGTFPDRECQRVWANLGPRAIRAAPVLLAVFESRPNPDEQYNNLISIIWADAHRRLQVAKLLVDMKYDPARIAPAVISLSTFWESLYRGRAIRLLGQMKYADPAVIQALMTGLRDDQWYSVGGDFYGNGSVKHWVADDAACALAQLGEAAVPLLRTALREEVAPVRRRAAEALGKIGPAAQAAVVDLLASLADADPAVRAASATALGGIGADRNQAVPAIQALLKDKRLRVREAAAKALKSIETRVTSHESPERANKTPLAGDTPTEARLVTRLGCESD